MHIFNIFNDDGEINDNGGKFKISPIDNDYAQIGLNDIDTNTNTKIYLNGGENKRIEYSYFRKYSQRFMLMVQL